MGGAPAVDFWAVGKPLQHSTPQGRGATRPRSSPGISAVRALCPPRAFAAALERSRDTREWCPIPLGQPPAPAGMDPNPSGWGPFALHPLLIFLFQIPTAEQEPQAFPAAALAGNDIQGLAGRPEMGLTPLPSPPLPGKQPLRMRGTHSRGGTTAPAAPRAPSAPQCSPQGY